MSDWFYNWELCGRGWQHWTYAVDLEPPFRSLGPPESSISSQIPGWEEPWANPAESGILWRHFPLPAPSQNGSVDISLPFSAKILERLRHPVAFELIAGGSENVRAIATISAEDVSALDEYPQGRSRLPSQEGDVLFHTLSRVRSAVCAIELGLAREFLVPLRPLEPGEIHPIKRVFAKLSNLPQEESAVLQVLVKPVREAWAREMLGAALGPSDAGLFEDDLIAPCRDKISEPLFAAAARVAGFSQSPARAAQIARDLADAFGGTNLDGANALIALPDSGQDREAILRNLLDRASHRCGMILNASEMALLMPLAVTRDSNKKRHAFRSMVARSGTPQDGVSVGEDLNSPLHARLRLSLSDRLRHMSITGASGRTKVNLLVELILHDLDERNGVGLVDCDGAVVDLILRRLPRHRLGDVTLIDPARTPVPIDLLRAETVKERSVLEGDLIAVLSRIGSGWGAQTSGIFTETVAALRGQDGVPTLVDVRRALAGRTFSATQAKPAGALIGALDLLLGRDDLRAIVAGAGTQLDFRRLLDGGVLLARMPDNGQEHDDVLAGMLLAQFHQAFIASAESSDFERPHFFLYVIAASPAIAQTVMSLSSIARTCRVGLIVDGALDQPMHMSVKCRADSPNVRVQIGQAGYTVEIPDLPIEPLDAGQRARDIVGVTARRYDLTDHGLAASDDLAAYPKIPRLAILPEHKASYAAGGTQQSRARDSES